MDIRDVRIDTMSTSQAVKVTHLPTGKSVVVDVSNSQYRNRGLALAALEDALKDEYSAQRNQLAGMSSLQPPPTEEQMREQDRLSRKYGRIT